MLAKWVSEQTARREGYRNGCQSFLNLAPKKRHLGKGLFLSLEDILLKKRMCLLHYSSDYQIQPFTGKRYLLALRRWWKASEHTRSMRGSNQRCWPIIWLFAYVQ